MKIAFADSSFYIALLISRDANHPKAKAVAASWSGGILTTEYALNEVANHLCGSMQHRAKFGQLLADIESDPKTRIVESSRELWKRGIDRYLSRSDKEWSLIDCISFVVMQDHGVTDALTADHHFEQAGFVALLRS